MNTAPQQVIGQAQSTERVARANSKLTLRHSESDLTKKNRIVPQRERSDKLKVTRRLREHILDVRKTLRAPCKINIKNVKKMFYVTSGTFWQRSTKYCACHGKWPPKPPLILTHPCQRFSSVQQAPCLPRGWKNAWCPAPVRQNDVSDFKAPLPRLPRKMHLGQKKSTARCLNETFGREVSKTQFRARLSLKTEGEGTFCCKGPGKKANTYETTSNEHQALTTTVRTLSVATLFVETCRSAALRTASPCESRFTNVSVSDILKHLSSKGSTRLKHN